MLICTFGLKLHCIGSSATLILVVVNYSRYQYCTWLMNRFLFKRDHWTVTNSQFISPNFVQETRQSGTRGRLPLTVPSKMDTCVSQMRILLTCWSFVTFCPQSWLKKVKQYNLLLRFTYKYIFYIVVKVQSHSN